ncbi:MAG: hypothetical protein C4B58_06790 [Deltaproteobacteria bacterium]|nr:MAG: hypothetical protein C4B58_06790 [Deltaproteobacteria bacterium]
MKKEGYRIDRTYESGGELAGALLDRMTCDQRWLTPERMAQRAEAHAGEEMFRPWHEVLPASIRKKMTADWGEVQGDLFVHEEKMHFAGLINGNVFISIQPPRGYYENEDPGKLPLLRPMIWEAVCGADLDKDLELAEKEVFADFDKFLERLHSYLTDLSDTMINDGLHIMGKAPEQDRLVEFLVQLTRLPNGDTPSLRESVLNAMGHGYDDLLENKGKTLLRYKGKTGGWIIQSAHEKALAMVKCLESNQFDATGINAVVESHIGRTDKNVAVVLDYICEILTPNIRRVTDEIDSSLTGFSGGFVLPGPSGAPSRGQADILPTGRNFFSVDPNKIPTPAAWEVGKSLGDALISRCLEETGKYPENIGIIVWGGSTMRSKGDDIAEIYYLMGVKPVWARGSGNVTGLEIIPSSELGRPRLDVVPRISGFFRDSFPNLVERIDEAARIVAALNEPPESNILRRNVLRDVESYIKQGMDKDEAMREATFRVFGCPSGTYGAGVSELVESKNWKTQEDLGNNYIRYTAHAYGKGSYGKQKPIAFRKQLSRMDVTVKNEDSREYDMMSCTDFYI